MSRASILLLGGSGLVGSCLVERWAEQAELEAPSHSELDVLDARALSTYLVRSEAHTVVNVAAWAEVDAAEAQRGDTAGSVYQLNVDFPRRLAAECRRLGKHLVHISTDYVFDGTKAEAPYTENDATRALCWYAETKLRGEAAVLESNDAACVVRIEMPFTAQAHRKRDLVRTIVGRLQQGQSIQGVTDQRITPVFLDDAADALWRIQDSQHTGIVHVAAGDWTTPFDLALGIAKRLRLNEALIVPETFERFSRTRPARRPQHSWLDVSRFTHLFGTGTLRPVDDELAAWITQWRN
jgi:dTDP-4-dehydrorhamnose reductase